MKISYTCRHSSVVHLHLRIRDKRIPLAAVGPGRCVARTNTPCPPCDAILEIEIDGHKTEQEIFLFHGIRGYTNEIEYF